MPTYRHDNLNLYFEQHGARTDPALLLLHGLNCQLVHWPAAFIDRLVAAELRVVTLDNRDMGLSDRVAAPAPDFEEIRKSAASIDTPYTLRDMGQDALALLNHLGLSGAHVVGLSMGGMIAQTLAIDAPERVFSLTSLMSSSGHRDAPPGQADAFRAFVSEAPDDRAGAIAHNQKGWQTLGGPHYDSMAVGLARLAETAYDRGFSREGLRRQWLAILKGGDRTDALRALAVPTLVLHGTDDPMIPLGHGTLTAETIPEARLVTIDKLGHDLPDPLLATLADHIIAHVKAVPVER